MPTKAPYEISSRSDFKSWVLMEPNAASLLKEIVYRWRASTIRARGRSGKWAVYPVDRWVEWTGFSRDKVKRALAVLVLDGLLLRERHRFAGTEVRTFLQPTQRALAYVGRPGDLDRLGAPVHHPHPSKKNQVNSEVCGATSAPTSAPTSALTSAPTDYTSFPSYPSCSSCSEEPSSHEEGKGKAGKAGSEKKGKAGIKLKLVKPAPKTGGTPPVSPVVSPVTPTPPAPVAPPAPAGTDDGDDFDEFYLVLAAKKAAKADKLFPVLKGAHEKHVKHPSEKFPNWVGFSPALQAKIYEKYKAYVTNWYKGKAGKPYSDPSDWTEEDDAEFMAAMAKLKPAPSQAAG